MAAKSCNSSSDILFDLTCIYKSIILFSEQGDESSDDSDDDINTQPISREESDDEDSLPVYLWKPQSHGLGDLGQWEAHTRVTILIMQFFCWMYTDTIFAHKSVA